MKSAERVFDNNFSDKNHNLSNILLSVFLLSIEYKRPINLLTLPSNIVLFPLSLKVTIADAVVLPIPGRFIISS